MKYKALMLDLDGTTIPNKRNGMPSKRVKNAINKASKKVHIGIATSRCLPAVSHIADDLNLSGPSILSGGAKIVTFPSKKVIMEQPIIKSDVIRVINIMKKFDEKFYVCDNDRDIQYDQSYKPQSVYMIFKTQLTEQQADKIVSAISHIPSISVHKIPDWTIGKFSISVTYVSATKQHGIFEVAKILGIETHEIIGVGDGYNDFPLLMACGLKVAMGNAVSDLKVIADYVAPTVDEDGVSDVIEKFIL